MFACFDEDDVDFSDLLLTFEIAINRGSRISRVVRLLSNNYKSMHMMMTAAPDDPNLLDPVACTIFSLLVRTSASSVCAAVLARDERVWMMINAALNLIVFSAEPKCFDLLYQQSIVLNLMPYVKPDMW